MELRTMVIGLTCWNVGVVIGILTGILATRCGGLM
jgi:hypothetical protein